MQDPRDTETFDSGSNPRSQDKSEKVLDYASSRMSPSGPLDRSVLILFALGGIALNLSFVANSVLNLHGVYWAYFDLRHDPRAYGREIDPLTIKSLQCPVQLWTSKVVFILAAGFGLMLAIEMMVAAMRYRRDPLEATRRLQQYVQWKWLGALITCTAFYWSSMAFQDFWIDATRHISQGNGPPIFSTLVLFICAMLPVVWVRGWLRGD